MTELDPVWQATDEWWEDYVADQEDDLNQLRGIIREFDRMWERSTCAFDRDPLVEDWTKKHPQAGPLRTNQEENWSQWLAHLLRDSSGEWTANLFGSRFDKAPSHVRCERAFHDDELHDRRVDILAEFAEQGLTIEVKVGDEHYEKTPQTAYITEKHYQRDLDWSHYLLLPEDKQLALRNAFGTRLKEAENDRKTIATDCPRECDVTVITWSDIARSLRWTLLNGRETNTHWAASAYLFTTLIEEQILQFYSLPGLEKYQDVSFGISDIDRLQSITPEDQITYFDTLLEEITNG